MRKRAALYVRVSTAEQRDHGLSVDSQIDALQKYCVENNLLVVDIYNDAGISARKKYKSRPALLRLLDDCKSKRVDLILFTKLDRWFRSVADYYSVQSVLDEAKIPWRAIWEDYETETSAGIFKVNIMLSIAQAESDRTSERIKAVNQYQREHGFLPSGKAPAGYIRTSKSSLEYDPETKDAIHAFFETYLNTFSPAQAMDAAREHGFTLSRKNANCLLQKEPYYGTYFGIKTPAYITQKQHELILQSRNAYTRKADQNRIYLFTGLLFCANCGSRMVAKMSKHARKGATMEFPYYVCRTRTSRRIDICGSQGHIMESHLEAYLLDHMCDLIDEYNAETQKITGRAKAAESKVPKVKGRLERLKNVYLDGDISREEYLAKTAELKAQLAELERLAIPAIPVKQLPLDWKETYMQLTQEGKKAFWHRTIRRIEIKKNPLNPDKVKKVYFV